MRRRAALLPAILVMSPAWLLAQIDVASARRNVAADDQGRWPALLLHDLNGVPYRGFDGSGRIRIVNLWARWCAPCRRELPSLQRLAQRLDASRYEVLTIALDDDAFALREFAHDLRLRLPILRGADSQLRDELKIRSLPQTLVVDADGWVRRRLVGARDWDLPSQRTALLQSLPGSGT